MATADTRGRAAPSAGTTPSSRRAAGLACSTEPARSTTTTGSGNESMVACAVFWARSSRAVPGLPVLAEGPGHLVEGMGEVSQLVAGGGRHDLVELAASQRTAPPR